METVPNNIGAEHDPLLDPAADDDTASPPPEKPKRKRRAAAKDPLIAPPTTKPEPESKVKRTRAKKAPEKRKPDTGWSKPKNYDDIKAKVKTKLRSLKDAIETAALAEALGVDAKVIRWACKDLAKEKLCKIRLNKSRRTEVIPIAA